MAKFFPNDDVAHRISHNNLHITCKSFEEAQASHVMQLLKQFHNNCDRVFIDVRGVTTTSTQVAHNFKTALSKEPISPKQIFFKGVHGFDLAINGNRVLVQNQDPNHKAKGKGHVCCGKCKNCHCKHEHQD